MGQGPMQFVTFNGVSMSTEEYNKNKERLQGLIKKDKETPVIIVQKSTKDDDTNDELNNVPLEEKNTQVEDKKTIKTKKVGWNKK